MHNKPQPGTHVNPQHLPEAANLQDRQCLSLHQTYRSLLMLFLCLEVLYQLVDAIGVLLKAPNCSERWLLTALN